ncbi:hypothetical protein LSAT2_029515 [Lamellibrachia satsuma]|nr:hypothetical protein LSAT2_029515 [Lamellibrachia satsuma]
MIALRVHVKLLLIAALLTVTVGFEPDDPYIVCIRSCAIHLNNCEKLFQDSDGQQAICRSFYYRCMRQCLKDHCPGRW